MEWSESLKNLKSKLSRIMLLAFMLTLLSVFSVGYSGCSSSGGDKDNTTDGDYPDAEKWEPPIPDGDDDPEEDDIPPVDGDDDDKDIEDKDTPSEDDGDTPGDIDENDIDYPDLDEEEIEFIFEADEIDTGPEKEVYIDCTEDKDCEDPTTHYCDLNTYKCEPRVDGDVEEEPACPGGLSECTAHKDCEPGSYCNPNSGCCEYDYAIYCSTNADCPKSGINGPPPTGSFCGFFHNGTELIKKCQFECLSNAQCEATYGSTFCCSIHGQCVKDEVCQQLIEDGDIEDEQEEEEEPKCSSCADCQGYETTHFCSLTSGYCEPGDCCQDSDCPEKQGYIVRCDRIYGTCKATADPGKGSISGKVVVPPDYRLLTFDVVIQKTSDNSEVGRMDLSAFIQAGSNYEATFSVPGLEHDNFNVFLVNSAAPNTLVPYEFNPVVVNFDSQDTKFVKNIDFYLFDIVDPNMAEISGNVTIDNDFFIPVDGDVESDSILRNARIDITVYLKNAVTKQLHSVEINASSNGDHPYKMENVRAGSYTLFAVANDGNSLKYDYFSKKLVIVNNPEDPQKISDVHFFFDDADHSLGSISGTIHYAEYYSSDRFGVKLYNIAIGTDFEVAQATIEPVKENEMAYNFPNVEEGNYKIVAEGYVSNNRDLEYPENDTADILASGTEIINRDVYFKVKRDNLGSISGDITYDSAIQNDDFVMEVHNGTAVDNSTLVIEDEIVVLEKISLSGSYFVGGLQNGVTYYLLPTAINKTNGTVTKGQTSGAVTINVSVPAEKDVEDVDLNFNTPDGDVDSEPEEEIEAEEETEQEVE